MPATNVKMKGVSKVEAKAPPRTEAITTKNLSSLIDTLKPQLARALPMHVPADRFCRVAMTTLRTNPYLLKIATQNPASLMGALMTAAQLGLEPDGVLGHGYLVPFGGKKPGVQFIPGYRGYIALARNSGEISHIAAECVHEHDEFDYELGLDPKLKHKPAGGDRGEMTHVYAVAKYRDGGHSMTVLTRADCEDIRQKFSAAFRKYGAKADTPWVTNFEAMCRKTAVRRLANMLPLSVQRAAAIESLYEQGRGAVIDDLGDVVPDVVDSDAEEVDEEQGQETPQEPAGDAEKAKPATDAPKTAREATAATEEQQQASEGEPDPTPLTEKEKATIKAAERAEHEKQRQEDLLAEVDKANAGSDREPGED